MTIFNNEESVLINGICKNEKLSSLTKDDAVKLLRFSMQVANDDDTILIDLIDGTLAKVEGLKDEEWDELKLLTPLPVITDIEDDEQVSSDDEKM